jgi:predicted CXXCH cytochrome family protein
MKTNKTYLPLRYLALATLLLTPMICLGADPGANEAHQGADCRTCHLQSMSAGSAALTGNQSCLPCHGALAGGGRSFGSFHLGAEDASCLKCHSFHAPDVVQTGLGSLSLAQLEGVAPDHCRSCHDGRGSLNKLSEAHRAAARLYHEQAGALKEISPSQGCLNCHSDGSATTWQRQAGGQVLAFSEHASHPFAVEIVPGQGSHAHRIRKEIDDRIVLMDGRIECQTCHNLTSESENLLATFPAPKDLCLGCHQFRDRQDQTPTDMMATMLSR